MEGRFVVTALFFTILAACSKQDIRDTSLQTTLLLQQQQSRQSRVYSSGWEMVPGWKAETSTEAVSFFYTRHLPELSKSILDDGVILVFARNLWVNDPALKDMDDAPEKPLMMPFYFLPYFEKPNYTEQWNYSAEENKINVSLVVKGGEDAAVPGKKIQLRFIVIPGEVLKEKKQTSAEVRKLSYDQLVKTYGLGL
jgi:hypothetical protein